MPDCVLAGKRLQEHQTSRLAVHHPHWELPSTPSSILLPEALTKALAHNANREAHSLTTDRICNLVSEQELHDGHAH